MKTNRDMKLFSQIKCAMMFIPLIFDAFGYGSFISSLSFSVGFSFIISLCEFIFLYSNLLIFIYIVI